MQAAGRAAYRARSEERSRIYAYETAPIPLAPEFTARFRKRTRAWNFFQAQPPWYRRSCASWVMRAKHEATRQRRFERLLDCSERGVSIEPLKYAKLRSSPRRPA